MSERNRFLLDCTLRDGGYVNDWKFGRDTISYIFDRQLSSNVDAIEIGFLDENRVFDPDRTIMPDTESANRIFGDFDSGDTMIVAMIDFGTCGIERIQPCEDTCLDGIRVIFKKEKMYEALDFCGKIKNLGYEVFVQAVSITSYSTDELKELICLVNKLKPYALSMVDTYGLLDSTGLDHIISIIDKEMLSDIALGYHAHNNFQLGYSNSVSVLNSKINRNIFVDGSLYGMGKSAGNAPIELIAMYMNEIFNKNYDVAQIQEAISTSILDIYRKQPWGYTLFYYIAALNKCHPNYVSYLMNKRTLSITAINEILQQIPKEKKLDKDMALIEELYIDYQSRECDDSDVILRLKSKLEGKTVLMIGPGKTVTDQSKKINSFIEEKNPIIISVNFIPNEFSPNYLFLTNSRRYQQLSRKLIESHNSIPIIATSNLTNSNGQFSYVANYSSLIDEKAEFPDNSMIMLLKLLRAIGINDIVLAGFDGYTPDNVNYFDVNMEYSFVKEKADSLNDAVRKFLDGFDRNISVTFITDSYYL